MQKWILLISVFIFSKTYPQIAPDDTLKTYYKTLISKLCDPDTLYVYELNSNWGSGMAYFVSRKNNKSINGYWINEKYSWNELMPRGILPKDSSSGITRIIIDTTINGSEIEERIYKNKIFEMRDEYQIKEKCGNENVYDGLNYQLTFLTNKVGISKSYYEIYEENCASIKEYTVFISLDKLFQKQFNRGKQ